MSVLIKRILRFLGFDRAVTFGILARVWSLFSGPITIMIVACGFSPEQQGFYYTFSSLLALQTFFDLGLMFVIAQFASHEFVKLSWGDDGALNGDPVALERFTDLLCKTTLWFGAAAALMVLALVPAGLLFFGEKGAVSFSWRLPWILAVVGTALNLFVMPFFALIMGSGDVVTVNKRELVAAVASSFLCWAVIGFHGGLYAAFAVNLGALFISWGYLLSRRPMFIKLAIKGWSRGVKTGYKISGGLSWWSEIWPMQWRMAVSSGAAYFMFQLFNPVLFHFHGAAAAGRMGMTLTAANALLAGSMTVLNARTPEFGKLVAIRDWSGLDVLFLRVTKHALALALFGACAGFAVIWQLQAHFAIGGRFIPAGDAALLFGAIVIQTAAGAFANYLRAHKQEPLMGMTIVASVLQGAGTWFLGKHFGARGVCVAFLSVTAAFVLPYVLLVWNRCRRQWHVT